ncbi:MAG: hypothetical protein IPK68_15125 [Bdellovibrionales bacterium]|nr:hypothetical protein [Bdellovibrionales bacterium]
MIGAGTKIDNLAISDTTSRREKLFSHSWIYLGWISDPGHNNFMGGRTSVAGHIVICDNVQAAGVSTIHKDVLKPGAYGGYPFIALKDFLKVQASSSICLGCAAPFLE